MKPFPHHNLVGREVGARRWPYHGAHPDCWREPHRGIVLALDDPRAWAGSIAFPGKTPDQAAVSAHVEQCLARGLLKDKVPVLWTFFGEEEAQWETVGDLKDAAEDHADWVQERSTALLATKTSVAASN